MSYILIFTSPPGPLSFPLESGQVVRRGGDAGLKPGRGGIGNCEKSPDWKSGVNLWLRYYPLDKSNDK